MENKVTKATVDTFVPLFLEELQVEDIKQFFFKP